jgi:sodium-dependent dicarboxylate transporter 2/3/5
MSLKPSRALIFVSIAFAVSLLLFLINPFKVEPLANKVLAVAAFVIVLWVSEAMPMAVVALLPLVLFPLLNIATLEITASSFANPIIFLFMGGFLIGLAIEKWNLHRRIALSIVQLMGTSGDRIVLGFIIASGFISVTYISRHKGLAIGNGLMFFLMHLVLIIGWVLAPAYAVIAATLSLHKLKTS